MKRELTTSQKNIDSYNASTKLRIEGKSIRVPCPQTPKLTEPCLIWGGYKDPGGYGTIGYNGGVIGVHVASLMIARGVNSLPKLNSDGEKLEVGHLCNVKDCCEPTHLYHATPTQNGEDQRQNGLMRGENHPNTTLSEDIARAIKLSKGEGTVADRAVRFNVGVTIVSGIDYGTSWVYLPDANGNTFESRQIEVNKKRKLSKKIAKETPWTREIYDKAQSKLENPNYARIDDNRSYNGTKCIIWIRTLKNGYGEMNVSNRKVLAHLVACTIANNYIRPDGMEASHLCGVAACVNPDHLQFKTRKDNIADKIVHGTHARKLSWAQVLEIRERYTNGDTLKILGVAYNVSFATIGRIVNNKSRING